MSETERVMIDIETLGLEVGASIISIGAVKFGTDGIGEEFYRNVDLVSCEDLGMHIDAETLEWWLHQSVEVQGQLTDGVTITSALTDLSDFAGEGAEVWANSPSFDCEMLEYAYDAVDMDVPWDYWNERDVRTVKNLPCAADVEMGGNEHDALDDARHQARIVGKTLSVLEAIEREI